METSDTLFTLWIGIEIFVAIFLVGSAGLEIIKNRLLAEFLSDWERLIEKWDNNPAILEKEVASEDKPLLDESKRRYKVFDALLENKCARMTRPIIHAMILGNIVTTIVFYYTNHYDLSVIGLYNNVFFIAVAGIARYFRDHLTMEAYRMARHNDKVLAICGEHYGYMHSLAHVKTE